MTLPSEPSERHRAVVQAFTERAQGVRDRDAPSPVEGWAARDVVRHLVTWFPAFLADGSDLRLEPGPDVDVDPLGAWTGHAAAVQALLEDPAAASRTFTHPHIPELPLLVAVDRFYTADVFMHTWDLSRASAQAADLDPDLCAELLAGMEPMDEALRFSGQYGPKVEVSPDAPVQDRLMAFIGRRPDWTPPA